MKDEKKHENVTSEPDTLPANQDIINSQVSTISPGRVRQIYLQVGFIGLLIAATLWYALQTSTRIVKQFAPLADAAMMIKLEATYAHLWFEEIISGDRSESIDTVWAHLDRAEWYAHVMLDGGQNAKGTYIPTSDSELRSEISDVQQELVRFREIAEQRYKTMDQSGIGSDLDQRFDSVFDRFTQQASDVETALRQSMARDIDHFRQVQLALIVLCLVLAGGAGVVLHRFERRRSGYVANLAAANQQLLASEQQLRAFNHQLLASEQQLKAANQQLQASEQQLKAANQQLRASEQQLMAANQQLRASESQLLEAQHIAGLGFYDLDITAGTWTSSSILDRLFGIDKDFQRDIDRWIQIVHPDHRDEMSKYFAENILAKHELFDREYRIIRIGDQAERWVHGLGRLELNDNGEPIRMIGTIQDITERKNAEEALRESEEKFRTLVESVNVIPWRFDLINNRFTFVGKQVERILGYTVESWTDLDSWSNRIHPGDRQAAVEYCLCSTEEGKDHDFEYRCLTAGGETVWLRDIVTVRSDETGKPYELVGYMVDISDRKLADEALRDSEEKFRKYVDLAPDAIFITDGKGCYLEVNEAASKLTGYSKSQLLSMSVFDLVDLQAQTEGVTSFEEFKEIGHDSSEVRMKCRDGSIIWVSLDAVALSEDRFMAFCSDITETKRLRELESRAQRLESAGKISGQIAHDFNNLLAPLIAYPDFIRDELPKNHPALTYVKSIEESAIRIADINQQLLTLGRRGHYNLEVLNLNEVVMRAVKEMATLPEVMVCDTQLDENLMNVMGGGSQIHRVISNLLLNAQDAMQGVGRIEVRTENYYVDEMSVSYGRVPKGEYVKVTVSDTGCGIPDELLQTVFDPFVTSKTTDKKRGSGLGLSVVDSVMKDHHGYIDLSTKVGHGTSIYLYFPITREDFSSDKSQPAFGGTETILVVDDDGLQRDVATTLLKKLGYEVSAVESGEKAIEFLKALPQELVILDMIMPPGIDGAETYRQISEFNSGQKTIIVSGFSETERVIEAQKLGAGAFIKKPLTGKAIAAAVRNELDRKKGERPRKRS